MAESKYVKTGYDNALEFDPASGIIRYGTYEFFANQAGIKPQTQTLTFDGYRRSLEPNNIWGSANKLYQQPLTPEREAKLRADFANAVQTGAYSTEYSDKRRGTGFWMGGANGTTPMVNTMAGPQNPNGDYKGMATITGGIPKTPQPSFREINQKDPNTFTVNTYAIPGDIEFVNQLNRMAANLSANAALGQTTTGKNERPAGQTGRLGKPNYSRAATVLAGQQTPLGGASTTLGS